MRDLIRKFAPIFNLEVADNAGILALVTMSAPLSKTDQIASDLGSLDQVYEVIVTTGKDNIVVKLGLENAQALQKFLTSAILKKLDLRVTGSQIITSTVKDEYPLPFAEGFRLNLCCDLCKGKISIPNHIRLKWRPLDTTFAAKRASVTTWKNTDELSRN